MKTNMNKDLEKALTAIMAAKKEYNKRVAEIRIIRNREWDDSSEQYLVAAEDLKIEAKDEIRKQTDFIVKNARRFLKEA